MSTTGLGRTFDEVHAFSERLITIPRRVAKQLAKMTDAQEIEALLQGEIQDAIALLKPRVTRAKKRTN